MRATEDVTEHEMRSISRIGIYVIDSNWPNRLHALLDRYLRVLVRLEQ